MRIGLLGGTFNPIHLGHLHVARHVLAGLSLDRVLFIPSSSPPHKAAMEILPADHRLAMTRLALRDDPHFESSDIEIKRGGISYSVETVLELKRLCPEDTLFFIMGMDAFFEIQTWREAERLLTLCNFVVVSREEYPFSKCYGIPLLNRVRASLTQLDTGQIGAYILLTDQATEIHFLRIPPCHISASEVRSRLLTHQDAKNLLPASVASYIMENRLY